MDLNQNIFKIIIVLLGSTWKLDNAPKTNTFQGGHYLDVMMRKRLRMVTKMMRLKTKMVRLMAWMRMKMMAILICSCSSHVRTGGVYPSKSILVTFFLNMVRWPKVLISPHFFTFNVYLFIFFCIFLKSFV